VDLEKEGRADPCLSHGHIHRLLSNPNYTGQIAHKGQLYPGQHLALVDNETWTVVLDQLAASAGDHRCRAKAAEPSLLAGLLVELKEGVSHHHTRSRKADAIATNSRPR
jgi:site-specific DNA recombinase